ANRVSLSDYRPSVLHFAESLLLVHLQSGAVGFDRASKQPQLHSDQSRLLTACDQQPQLPSAEVASNRPITHRAADCDVLLQFSRLLSAIDACCRWFLSDWNVRVDVRLGCLVADQPASIQRANLVCWHRQTYW